MFDWCLWELYSRSCFPIEQTNEKKKTQKSYVIVVLWRLLGHKFWECIKSTNLRYESSVFVHHLLWVVAIAETLPNFTAQCLRYTLARQFNK